MKFDIKSAVPSAAIALLAVSSAAKLENAVAKTAPSYTHEQAMALDFEQQLQDEFGFNSQATANDSFGACDSSGTSDSCGSGDSLGTLPEGTMGFGVWTIERDNTPYDGSHTAAIYDTVCFKTNTKYLIGRPSGGITSPSSVVQGQIYSQGDRVRMVFSSDQKVADSGSARMYLRRPADNGANQWTGFWISGTQRGTLKATLHLSTIPWGNQYQFSGCTNSLGY